MKVTIQPSTLKGSIQAPASKSSMQRACAAALLTKGGTVIHNPGHSNDDKAAIEIIKALGAEVLINNEELIINNSQYPLITTESPITIDCGESGLSIRMFTPLVALSNKEITITGSGSLATRPMDGPSLTGDGAACKETKEKQTTNRQMIFFINSILTDK